MSPRSRVDSLPPGISRTSSGGYRVRVWIHRHETQRRFKADIPIEKIVGWQTRRREQTQLPATETSSLPGSFAADVEQYLPLRASMPTIKERRRDLALWEREFGDLPREAITAVMIRGVTERWLTVGPKLVQKWARDSATGKKVRTFVEVEAPLSASCVAHRMRALENFYTVLGGRQGRNPVREVPEPTGAEGPVRDLPVDLIRALFAMMPASQSKARLGVLAWTGIPPATLKRITRETFDRERAAVWVPGRKKGKGTSGRWQPLTREGLAAFIELDRWNAWGPHSWDTVRRSYYHARKRLNDPRLKGVPPYQLRGAFATRMYVASGDFKATSGALGHASPKTTERYAAAALDPRQRQAVASLNRLERVKPKRRKPKAKKGSGGRKRGRTGQQHRTTLKKR